MRKVDLENAFDLAKEKLINKIYKYVEKKCLVECQAMPFDRRFRFFPIQMHEYDGFVYLAYKNNPDFVHVEKGEEDEEYTDTLEFFSLDELNYIVESIIE